MKKVIGIIIIFCQVLFACKSLTEVHPMHPAAQASNATVNNWIYDQMKLYYLWTDQMKPLASTNVSLEPASYFDSLLVQPGVLDRFSWIQTNVTDLTNTLNGVNKVLGTRTAPFYSDRNQINVALSVAYVIKNSPAETAGLKRGDLIIKVDGQTIDKTNYTTALANETMTLGLGIWTTAGIVDSGKSITVTKAQVQTNPIQFDTILTQGSKKIGYMVYLQFLTDYNDAVRTVFRKFKAAGVSELVLDLRFNGGGYIAASDVLSSLIVKNLNTSEVMNKQVWNDAQTNFYISKYGENALTTFWKNEADNLGNLKRVFILTSNNTASASELVINNLKPKMPVVLIGTHTYGKNVGSITISDAQKRWEWGMQPIVLKTFNMLGQSDYGTKNGFLPDFEIVDNVLPFKPFGDTNETFLNIALQQIAGVTARKSYSKTEASEYKALSTKTMLDNPHAEINDMFIKSK